MHILQKAYVNANTRMLIYQSTLLLKVDSHQSYKGSFEAKGQHKICSLLLQNENPSSSFQAIGNNLSRSKVKVGGGTRILWLAGHSQGTRI